MTSKGNAKESLEVTGSGHCWYLPHHGEYHPNKPGKICVVFDLSAEHCGASINKELLPGPYFTIQVVGVFFCFREEPIKVTGEMKLCFTS